MTVKSDPWSAGFVLDLMFCQRRMEECPGCDRVIRDLVNFLYSRYAGFVCVFESPCSLLKCWSLSVVLVFVSEVVL